MLYPGFWKDLTKEESLEMGFELGQSGDTSQADGIHKIKSEHKPEPEPTIPIKKTQTFWSCHPPPQKKMFYFL